MLDDMTGFLNMIEPKPKCMITELKLPTTGGAGAVKAVQKWLALGAEWAQATGPNGTGLKVWKQLKKTGEQRYRNFMLPHLAVEVEFRAIALLEAEFPCDLAISRGGRLAHVRELDNAIGAARDEHWLTSRGLV